MPNETFTPGPWHVERVENRKYPDLPTFHVLALNEDAGKSGVSYAGTHLSVARELDSEADARLIAAAPALLATLTKAERAPWGNYDWLEEARAAIKLATYAKEHTPNDA